MSDFDPITYLNSRFQETIPVSATPPIEDKLSAVLRARQEKTSALQAWRDRGAQLEASKRKSYDSSVIGILGMKPDGLAATALNTTVGVGSGLTNIAANIGSSIHAVDAAAQTHGIPEEARAAFGRWKQGAATDPNSPTFAPHKALQALVGNGTQESATPENRKTNLEKATALLDQFKSIRDRTQSAFDSVSPESRKEEEATLASFKEMLAQTTDPAMKSMLEDEIRITQAELDKTVIKPEELKARQDAFDKASKDFDKAQALHTELANLVKHDEAKSQESDAAKLQKYSGMVSMAPEELDAQVKLADSQVDAANPEAVKASSQAVSKVISLAMASPGSVSVQTAQQLASNMGNSLTQAQRNYLRAFSEARLAHNLAMNAKGVQKEVFEGDKTTNQKGIATYEAEMAQAVATNNKAKAQSSLTGLTRFASDHASKLEAANKAMTIFEKTDVPQQIYSNGQRQWSVTDTVLPEAERRSKGGLEIGAKSAGVIRAIQQEAHALNMAAAAHQAAFDMAFGGGDSGNAAAVPASRVSSAKPSAPPVRAAKEGEVEESRSNQSSQEEPTHFKGPESTQVSQESEQAAPDTSEVSQSESESESESESGGLSAYQEKRPEGASYTEVNLIEQYFTQTGKKEGDATGRPLVEVKDFMSALREQKTNVSVFFEGELTDKQRALVKMFAGLVKKWDAKIEEAVNHRQALEYRYQDMFSYLVNPDGSVDQNVKTAITLAAFTTLAENIEKGKHNTDQDINRILLKDDDAEVSPEAKRLLGKVGLRRNMLISSAGQKAVQALGLRAKKDAPQDLMARLEMALGAHAIKLLAEEGLVELKAVSSEEMNTLLDSKYAQNNEVDTVQEGSVLYARHGGGQMPWQTGIMSYTGMGAKGTEAFDAQMTGSNAPAIGVNKQPEIDVLFRANPGFDPVKVKKAYLAPTMNGDGYVSNWRYLMQADTRDNVLERNSSFEDVMGKMAGSILDKETTQEHNRTVVQALLEEYRAEAPRKMDQYLLVGEDSTDPELQAIYRMLPESTRREIEDAWGMKGMRVKAEMIDLVFGYRKLSLSSAFDKEAGQRTPVETIFVGFVENLMTYVGEMKYPGDRQKAQAYAKRAGVMVRKGERAWQEIVQEVKDVIVIRSGVVLLGNVISNMTLLAAQGVSMKDMARHHAVAYKAVTAYQHDSEELSQLQGQLDADYVTGDEGAMRRRIVELEDALARNPVKDLIEAGMLPSIVEDVETEADPYSYKSQLQQKTGKFTSKINPHVLSVVQHATVSRGTPLYNFLHKQTQMSDFVARYTLFQHLTTRKENPLSRQDALHQASESFINYDIPMHRTMQYIDDMGLIMFNKYFFRIQRVLLKTAKENPARVLALVLMKNYLVNIPTVLDASAIHHIGNNPFSSGALQLPFLMDDLLTSKMGEALLK